MMNMGPIPPGFGNFQRPGGIPSYPGPAWIQDHPRFQYGPSFDGLYSHGLTTNPYINSILEDTDQMQHQTFSGAGTGYPTFPIAQGVPGMMGPRGYA